MTIINITVQEVFLALGKCKHNSSPGPDGIPEIVLSHCRYALTLPLHYLFSLSLSSGTFPDLWKSSYVQPVFKNGDRFNILLRSILEYCSILWNSYQLVRINKIERVQNKFLRYINMKIPNNCIITDHYYEPLRRLVNINSLSSRRLYFDVIFIYNILHGTIKNSFLLSNINSSVLTFNSRNRQTFHISIHKTLYGFFSPINRALLQQLTKQTGYLSFLSKSDPN